MAPASWDVNPTDLALRAPPVATGDIALSTQEAYLVATAGGGASEIALQADTLTLTIVREEVRVATNPLGGGPVSHRGTPTVETRTFQRATLALDAADAPDLLIALGDTTATGRVQSIPLAFADVRQPPTACGGSDPRCRFTYDYPVAMEWGGAAVAPFTLSATGPVAGRALDGVGFTVTDAAGTFEVTAGERATAPSTGGLVQVVERTYVYLDATGATLDVTPTRPGLVVGITEPHVTLDGTLRVPRATGTVDAGDRIVSVADEEVVLTGALSLTLRPGPAPGALVATSAGDGSDGAGSATVGGSASALTVAGVAYGVPPWRGSERVVAAAGAAIVLIAIFEKARSAGLIALAPFYTRLRRRDLLKNETRSQIFDLVRAQPGMHFRALLRETGLAPGTLQHHLHTLERQGFVRSMAGDSRRLYFPTGMQIEASIESHEALSKPTAVQVAQALMEAPGATQASLTASLGMNQTTVSYNLRKLVEAGLVVAGDGRPKTYTPTTTLERLLPAS